jgi:GMP synthase (glutamine-hydrolysing)
MSILVLQQVAHERLGSLEDHFRQAGLAWRYVELYREVPPRLDLDRAAGLVVLGGPMNVDEVDKYPFLAREIGWIQEAVDQGIPFLGVCLGSQLLAKALGAKVYPNEVKEIGWYEIELTAEGLADPLLVGSQPRETVFQWHGDTFDLPPGAVHLAWSSQCRHQMFRYGRAAYGVQFHVEMTPQMVHAWLGEPDNCNELSRLDYIDPAGIRANTPACFPRMQSFAKRLLPRFAALCAGWRTASSSEL